MRTIYIQISGRIGESRSVIVTDSEQQHHHSTLETIPEAYPGLSEVMAPARTPAANDSAVASLVSALTLLFLVKDKFVCVTTVNKGCQPAGNSSDVAGVFVDSSLAVELLVYSSCSDGRVVGV